MCQSFAKSILSFASTFFNQIDVEKSVLFKTLHQGCTTCGCRPSVKMHTAVHI